MIRTNKEILDYFDRLGTTTGLDYLNIVSFTAGDFLIHQHTKGNYIYVVKSGIAKCFVQGENGRDFVQEFVGDGEILGEIEVFTNTLSFSNVIALTSLSAYKVAKKDFYTLMKTDVDFNPILVKALATKIRNTAIRSSQQQIHPVDYNLKQLLTLISDQKINFSKQDLSDYLGITLRSLNRSIKKLSKDN